jgi:hypothetical protein
VLKHLCEQGCSYSVPMCVKVIATIPNIYMYLNQPLRSNSLEHAFNEVNEHIECSILSKIDPSWTSFVWSLYKLLQYLHYKRVKDLHLIEIKFLILDLFIQIDHTYINSQLFNQVNQYSKVSFTW